MRHMYSHRRCSIRRPLVFHVPPTSSPVSRRRAHRGVASGFPRGISYWGAGCGWKCRLESHGATQFGGSNNGSNLYVNRNLFTYQDKVAFTTGSHQLTAGVWLQRVQSNEVLALSQYGQATFTSLQTLLQGIASSLLYDPRPTEMGWRSWLGAWFVEDTVRLGSTHGDNRISR